ncbi:hypothetical protein PVT67_05250 [Gallaecimonas kandeliae]|uniref:hypothetical protein n=1 Tax=Gallaecimonas kandeliae TaxID=3029055 RepID=UPI0026473DA4|nr:hypothetical protein [Gallaecimonas kandeliae]WKE66652.1 hypothetical protein PVT67_05250 [Gallaecimonas kandeliae]
MRMMTMALAALLAGCATPGSAPRGTSDANPAAAVHYSGPGALVMAALYLAQDVTLKSRTPDAPEVACDKAGAGDDLSRGSPDNTPGCHIRQGQ